MRQAEVFERLVARARELERQVGGGGWHGTMDLGLHLCLEGFKRECT